MVGGFLFGWFGLLCLFSVYCVCVLCYLICGGMFWCYLLRVTGLFVILVCSWFAADY